MKKTIMILTLSVFILLTNSYANGEFPRFPNEAVQDCLYMNHGIRTVVKTENGTKNALCEIGRKDEHVGGIIAEWSLVRKDSIAVQNFLFKLDVDFLGNAAELAGISDPFQYCEYVGGRNEKWQPIGQSEKLVIIDGSSFEIQQQEPSERIFDVCTFEDGSAISVKTLLGGFREYQKLAKALIPETPYRPF